MEEGHEVENVDDEGEVMRQQKKRKKEKEKKDEMEDEIWNDGL